MADASAGLAPDELFVGASGAIWLADVGAAFPATHTAQPNASWWTGLGYTSEDGPKFTFDKTVKKIMGWQSPRGLRSLVTERPEQVEFELLQWKAESLKMAMGGGSITALSGSGAQYTPPDASEITEKAMIIEGQDGTDIVRFCFRKVTVVDKVEFGFKREEETRFPLTLDILEADDEDDPAWFIQTNLADIVAGIET